MWISR